MQSGRDYKRKQTCSEAFEEVYDVDITVSVRGSTVSRLFNCSEASNGDVNGGSLEEITLYKRSPSSFS
ncbi:hypothetical protein RCL_jg9258.t1 [Rhizophagus clarus]|uniref:Uncharacterized protein n=1 Tax=Rhizophagus clarus TaxID=94130 RepID=A0A8H3R0P5_9GLOM|nr:hypothetical protein RCL_jg9258.t1 [Rhizophagus clarus]